MLNIFKYNLNFNKINNIKNTNKVYLDRDNGKNNNIDYTRHFPPANKEWYNNIYTYNKNYLRHLPVVDKMILKLIKSYFNLFSPKFEKKINSVRLRIRARRSSVNRIFVSKAELKHTSSKVIITLFIYNRQKLYIFNKLKKINTLGWLNDMYFLKKIKLGSLRIIEQVKKEKKLLAELLERNINNFNGYEESLLKIFLIKSLEKEMLKVKYDNLLYLNKSKFENTYLIILNTLINQIYKKKVEFNIVNLKYLHLSSDILSESIAMKLRNRNNRLLQVLKRSLKMIKLPFINKLSVKYNFNKIKLEKLLLFNNTLLQIFFKKYQDKPNSKDEFDQLLQEIFPSFTKKDNIQNSVLNCINYKSISGVRLEAAGRLSRRLTAARSVFKFKYKGSLKNIDSSYKGLSTVILRGHLKSNVQFTNINSKTRNGSFGIKGWVSSI